VGSTSTIKRFNYNCIAFALAFAIAGRAASLGPHQAVLLVRADHADGLRVANHYRLVRRIPLENVVYLPYTGSAFECTWEQFDRLIRRPTLEHLARRKLADRVFLWITTPGLPHQVGQNSISSAIHFGEEIRPVSEPQLGPAGFKTANEYFDRTIAIDGLSVAPRRPLHMLLAAGTTERTLAMIDRAAAADGASPDGTVYLCEGVGPRSSRKGSIPHAKALLQWLGKPVAEMPGGEFKGKNDVLGLFTGEVSFPISANRFAPGALADHLTSFGGRLADGAGQMLCWDFLDAGCAATYGTVVEPFNYPQKFPTALVHGYYAAGFTAVESYWMSVKWPQQGLFMGDPLARPFGSGPKISVIEPRPYQEVGDKWLLNLTAASQDDGAGIGVIEFWIDDQRLAVLSQPHLPADATVAVTIGERNIGHTCSKNETLDQLTASLTGELKTIGVEVLPGGASLFLLHRPNGGSPPTLKASSSSPSLQVRFNQDRFVPSSSSRLPYDFAWLRFGFGPPRQDVQTKANTPTLTEGLHRLRIIVYRGSEVFTPTVVEVPFVRRTLPGRLKLVQLKESLSLGDSPTPIVKPKLDGLLDSSPIEYRVDERIVAGVHIDPKQFGVGRHTIRARTQFTGPPSRSIEADNEVEFTISP
jgi:uncharacterized protein (TIGR03790 family)